MIEHLDTEKRERLDRALQTSAVRPDGTPDWYDPDEAEFEGEMTAEEEAQAMGLLGNFARPGQE